MQPFFMFLEDQQGRYPENQKWQRIILNELAAQAVTREFKRHPMPSIFQDIIGHEDHYLLIGGDRGALIDGYNFHGSLSCRSTKLPPKDDLPTIEAYGKKGKINRVSCKFRNGFVLDWRAHVKGAIGPSCFGGSLVLSGVPSGFYREEQ